jgi:NAD(P)-dependent dehydrogenase (short-subunit alcohol dehydrogenase family)
MGHPSLDLNSRNAVVIGGTSGIGLTLAKGLAEAGANVVPTGRRADLARDAACAVQKLGRKSLVTTCDITDRATLESLCDTVTRELGPVDILVNCAGITQRTAVLDVGEDEWARILDINLNGTLRGCQVFGRAMIERGYGRIINIASLSSFMAWHEVAAYSAAKSAVASLTKSLALEWAKHGVCVNALVPGVFRTDMNSALLDGTPRAQQVLLRTPMGRFGKLDELVGAAVFLASDAASFVTGHLLVVDGGFLASGVTQ